MGCTNNDLLLVVLFIQFFVVGKIDLFLKTNISGNTTSNLNCEVVTFSA